MNLPTQARTWNRPAILLAALLAVNFALRLVIALRPLACLDGMTIPDDAYLSLKIAKNIAQGLGPLYGTAHTNGFQPLYVFLAVPFYWIWPTDLIKPVHAALVMLSVFDTLALFFLYRLVARRCRSAVAPFFAVVAWITSVNVIGATLNGLETIIAFCFIVWVFDDFFRFNPEGDAPVSGRRDLLLGGLVGLAILARIDSIFLLPALAVGIAHREEGRPGAFRTVARRCALLALGALIVNLPWLAVSLHYTGDLYPISGRAVRYMALSRAYHNASFMTLYVPSMTFGMNTIRQASRTLLYLIAALVIAALFLRRRLPLAVVTRRVAGEAPIFFFAAAIYFAYTGYILSTWFFIRYLFPVALVFLVLASSLVDLVGNAIASVRLRRLFYGLVFTGLLVGQGLSTEWVPFFTSPPSRDSGYMNLGLWAREHLKPGSVVGSSQSGALGYFADNLKVINLDGVVNKDCYRALVERRYMDYIRGAGVEYVLGWPANIGFIARESRNFRKADLIDLGTLKGFRSWGEVWSLYQVRRQ